MKSAIRRAAGLFAIPYLLSAGPLSAQRFEGTMTVHVSAMPAGAKMQYFIKGEKIRLEMGAPNRPAMALITDADAKRQYTIFPDQRAYSVTSLAEIKKATDSITRRAAATLKDATMTPTAKTVTVAGHACTVHRYHDREATLDICLTTELGAVGGTRGLFGSIGPLAMQQDPPAWAERLLKKGSFALRVTDTTGVVVWDVLKVEPKTLDPTLFAPPAGYRPLSTSSPKPPA